MNTTQYSESWNGVTKFIHWTFVLIILTMAIVGLTMEDIESPGTKIAVIAFHKSLGITALALAAFRLVWRLISKDPPKIPSIPTWQHLIAKVTHALIYVFLFIMPISGWVMNSAKGYPLQWFKLFNIPAITAKNPHLADVAHEIHESAFWVLTALIVMHVGAAFYHHIFQRDATLKRMLP